MCLIACLFKKQTFIYAYYILGMGMNMKNNEHKSGLSANERHVIQLDDLGTDEIKGDYIEKYFTYIKQKVQGTISDTKLILENRKISPRIEKEVENCKADLKKIQAEIEQILQN